MVGACSPMIPISAHIMNFVGAEKELGTTPLTQEAQHASTGAGRATHGAGWESFFEWLTRLSAVVVMLMLAGIFVVLLYDSLPALRKFGAGFFINSGWNPVTENFGALAPVCGTLISSLIAMLVGVPLALGVALFINELCPHRIRPILTVVVELLAAIPSIIYGMWGLFVLAPFLASHVQPALIKWIGPLPVVGALFQGPPFGIGMLTAGMILGVMILPFIASVSRQVFATTPPMLRDAAYGIGANTWEVSLHVLIPYARTGLLGGIMLGLGRALGETMAVTFVIGNAHRIAVSLLAPGTTISASLANEFTEAVGDIYLSSLLALGLILFMITFAVLFLARYLLRRVELKVAA
jgi:phosphate transport system permease protein